MITTNKIYRDRGDNSIIEQDYLAAKMMDIVKKAMFDLGEIREEIRRGSWSGDPVCLEIARDIQDLLNDDPDACCVTLNTGWERELLPAFVLVGDDWWQFTSVDDLDRRTGRKKQGNGRLIFEKLEN